MISLVLAISMLDRDDILNHNTVIFDYNSVDVNPTTDYLMHIIPFLFQTSGSEFF